LAANVARKCAISRILSQQRQFAMGTNAVYCDNGPQFTMSKEIANVKTGSIISIAG